MLTKSPKKKSTSTSLARSLPPRPATPPPDPARAKISPREYTALTNFPELYGEESESGSIPHPESDDDTLKDIHEWGFDLNADLEHPKQMDLQKQLDQAEKIRRKKRDIS